MRYAKIREMDISNGDGVGVSLFVQGCHFHCKGCFNHETWDFDDGRQWTQDIEEKFIKLASKPYIKRVSILGGEPMADENVESVYRLITRLKSMYLQKQVWLYTGYTWESIMNSDSSKPKDLYRIRALAAADVVVDGQFQLDKQDLFNEKIVFAGSTNQRVIDVEKSVISGKIVLHT